MELRGEEMLELSALGAWSAMWSTGFWAILHLVGAFLQKRGALSYCQSTGQFWDSYHWRLTQKAWRQKLDPQWVGNWAQFLLWSYVSSSSPSPGSALSHGWKYSECAEVQRMRSEQNLQPGQGEKVCVPSKKITPPWEREPAPQPTGERSPPCFTCLQRFWGSHLCRATIFKFKASDYALRTPWKEITFQLDFMLAL